MAKSLRRPSGRYWTKEDKAVRVRIERVRRHRTKQAIQQGKEPERTRKTEGWETW